MKTIHGERRGPAAGFTLVEMAIVLIIVGILSGLTLPLISDLIKREKRSEANNYLEQVRNEIIGYALINRRLPRSTDSTDMHGNAITIVDSDDLSVGKDPYGNKVQYVVDSALSSSDLCSTDPVDDVTLRLTEPSTSGNTDTDNGDMGFIIYTAGRNVTTEVDNPSANIYQVWDPRAYSGTSEEFDDPYEYVSFNYLRNKVCTNTSSNSFTPAGSDVSFSQNISDFTGDSTGVSPYGSDGGAVTVNSETDEIQLGQGEDATGATAQDGCIWYQGNEAAGNCGSGAVPANDPGVCEWGGGLRAYFEFTARAETENTARGWGGGFTFAVVNGANAADACGAEPTNGAFLGYAGTTGGGIADPKLAQEFDFAYDNSKNDPGGNADNSYNHASWVFWGENAPNVEDNEHGVLIDDPDPHALLTQNNPVPTTTAVPAPGGYGVGDTQRAWLEDGIPKTVRVEIVRTDLGSGVFEYDLQTWVECTDINCADLTNDMATLTGNTVQATTHHTFQTDSSLSWEDIRFGWTVGTGGYDGDTKVVLSDFGIKFLP